MWLKYLVGISFPVFVFLVIYKGIKFLRSPRPIKKNTTAVTPLPTPQGNKTGHYYIVTLLYPSIIYLGLALLMIYPDGYYDKTNMGALVVLPLLIPIFSGPLALLLSEFVKKEEKISARKDIFFSGFVILPAILFLVISIASK